MHIYKEVLRSFQKVQEKTEHFIKQFFQKAYIYKEKKDSLLLLLHTLFTFFTSFIFSSFPFYFGTFPFGIAFLFSQKKNFIAAYVGMLSAIYLHQKESALFLTILYTVGWMLRTKIGKIKIHSDKLSAHPIALHAFIALLLSFVSGVFYWIKDGFSLHAFMGIVLYILFTPLSVFFYSSLFKDFQSKKAKTLYDKVSFLYFSYTLLFSLRSFKILNFSPAAAVGVLLCFLFSEKNDLLLSSLFGLILGLSVGSDFVPLFFILCFVHHLLSNTSRRLSCGISLLCAFAFSFYLKKGTAFLEIMPHLISGLLLYLPFVSARPSEKAISSSKEVPPEKEEQGSSSDVYDFAETLYRLSDRLQILSKKLRLPKKEDAVFILDDCQNKFCTQCGSARSCFQKGNLEELSSLLHQKGKLDSDKKPAFISSGCLRWKDFANAVNARYARRLLYLADSDRSLCYAFAYQNMGDILQDRKKELEAEEHLHTEMTSLFHHALQKENISFKKAAVYGLRTLRFEVEFDSFVPSEKAMLSLRKSAEQFCHCRLSDPVLLSSEKQKILKMERMPLFTVETGYKSETKAGEDYSGDTVRFFSSHRYFYCFLSDGMGSGRDAALVSNIACHFLEQLTAVSASLKTILKTINDFLLQLNCECSATFDLLRIDLYNGQADFVKSGACPSLVLRKDHAFKISSVSIPVGATFEVRSEQISVALKPEDVIVMASDGVAGDLDNAPWLVDLLCGKMREQMSDLSEDLLFAAMRCEKKPDDRTVLAIRILKDGEKSASA